MGGDAAFDAQPTTPEAHAAPLDPLDPEWMQSLEELPQRIAESVAESAAGTEALEQIGRELEGHRQTNRAIAGAVRRLPDMAAGQAELTRQTNTALDRQALVLESMLDGITGLRAAFQTVEESSRRHLRAIAQLEAGHRQVLFEYQTLLLATHARLTRLAALGIILAAAALGGVGYAIYLVTTMGQ
jgi:ferric-dicitrate binding protein FerR (iron transport regulator)